MSRKALLGATTALSSLCISAQAVSADTQNNPTQTVVITATPLPQDPDYLATLVEQVSRDKILRSGGANLADALADVPGVTGTSFASGASRPVIRGFDANRVKTLENGIGTFDVSDVGPDHGVPVDPLSAQSVEVVRGAATLRYGSQAIGGVVNAINNRVPSELPEKPLAGEVAGTYGTNADSREASALSTRAPGSSRSISMASTVAPATTTFRVARSRTRSIGAMGIRAAALTSSATTTATGWGPRSSTTTPSTASPARTPTST